MSAAAAEKFTNNIDHIWVAYSFFEQSVPVEATLRFPVRLGRIEFERPSQVASVRVELGWAFYTRLEACLEALLHRLGLQLSRKHSLVNVCESRNLTLTASDRKGLGLYRELRNVLHHADGDPSEYRRELQYLMVDDGAEPHLEREHVEGFYRLFRKLGRELALLGTES